MSRKRFGRAHKAGVASSGPDAEYKMSVCNHLWLLLISVRLYLRRLQRLQSQMQRNVLDASRISVLKCPALTPPLAHLHPTVSLRALALYSLSQQPFWLKPLNVQPNTVHGLGMAGHWQ